MSAVGRLIGHLAQASERRAHAVPCSYGCGTWLPIADAAQHERMAHYDACPAAKATSLKQRTADLIAQNPERERA